MSFSGDVDRIIGENRNGLLGAHPSWQRVKLIQVADILNGFPFESSRFRKEGGTPLIRIRDIVPGKTETYYEGSFDEAFLVQPGELLVGMDGDFNCALWQGKPGLLNQRVCKLSSLEEFYSKRFLSFVLPGYLEAINSHTSSVTVKHLSSRTVADVPLPLPPKNEQLRIVAELDKQFTRLEAGVAALCRVQANLKRYRAAVLKAACEGKLVPTEVELQKLLPSGKKGFEPPVRLPKDMESGEQLLQRILAERRNKWNGKGKYKEPAPPDTTNLPQIPEGWTWANLDQLLLNITDGDHQPPPQTQSGVPFLVIGNVRSRQLDFSDTRFVSRDYADKVEPFRKPAKGDILYTLVGSYGIALRVPSDREFCVQRHIGVMRPHNLSPSEYLVHVLNSHFSFQQASTIATGTAQKTVPLAGLRRICIPLPPHAEQKRIVAEVERRLSVVEELETLVSANLLRANRLRKGIAKYAVEGKITYQDVGDESAELLLKRITSYKRENGTQPKRPTIIRARDEMNTTFQLMKEKTRRQLFEALEKAKQPLSPEQLFAAAGFVEEEVEAFFEELKREERDGRIREERTGKAGVQLVAVTDPAKKK